MRRRPTAKFEMRIPYTSDSNGLTLGHHRILKLRRLGEHCVEAVRYHLLLAGYQHIRNDGNRARHAVRPPAASRRQDDARLRIAQQLVNFLPRDSELRAIPLDDKSGGAIRKI